MTNSHITDRVLPNGWHWAQLGELCKIVIGKTPSRDNPSAWGGPHPWVKISDMDTDLITTTSETLSDEGWQVCRNRLLSTGTLLYSFKLTIGKTAFAGMDLFTNEAIAGLSPKRGKELSMPFIRYALRLTDTSEHSENAVKGRTLNKQSLASLPIPLPSLDEQQRVVDRLEEQVVAADRVQYTASQVVETACALPSALLRKTFPSREEETPEGWRWVRLGEVVEFLDSRRQPINETERTRRNAGKAPDSLYPYYGANGQVDWIDDYLFDEPTVLLAEDGGFFGSSSKPIAYRVDGKYWVNNHAHVLRPLNDILLHYLHYALSVRPDVGPMVSGSTRGKLNQTVARQIPIPLPPLEEQQLIVSHLEEQMAAAEHARHEAEAQAEAAAAITTALLRSAFAPAL